MSQGVRELIAGLVGRPHGLDGSFYLDAPGESLDVGVSVAIADQGFVVDRVAGSGLRPIVRLAGIATRAQAETLRGRELRVTRTSGDLAADEYFAADLVGCTIERVGVVTRVISAPSCDLLEVGDAGLLVPLIRDAVLRIDPEAGVIEVDRRFLGLDDS